MQIYDFFYHNNTASRPGRSDASRLPSIPGRLWLTLLAAAVPTHAPHGPRQRRPPCAGSRTITPPASRKSLKWSGLYKTEYRSDLRKTVAARGFVSGRGPLDYGLADANTFADDRPEDSGRDSAS